MASLKGKNKDEKLGLTIKEEWAGKEIIVMPYLVKPSENVNKRVKVIKFPMLIVQGKKRVGQNMTTNIGNNLTNNILGNEITKIEGGVKQEILGDFLFLATNVQQEIKGDKSEDILGKLVQSTAETYAQATQGDMVFQSNNISKFLGKTDVKVNKTSGEMMAVPKVSQIKNKERNEKTPEILET